MTVQPLRKTGGSQMVNAERVLLNEERNRLNIADLEGQWRNVLVRREEMKKLLSQ